MNKGRILRWRTGHNGLILGNSPWSCVPSRCLVQSVQLAVPSQPCSCTLDVLVPSLISVYLPLPALSLSTVVAVLPSVSVWL
jgi:hypothetical protein